MDVGVLIVVGCKVLVGCDWVNVFWFFIVVVNYIYIDYCLCDVVDLFFVFVNFIVF